MRHLTLARGFTAVLLAIACSAVSAQYVPAFKVSPPKGPSSLLIGSLHIAANGLYQPAASVMDGARRYVVEGVPTPGEDSPLWRGAPNLQQGQFAPWAQGLTIDQIGQLRKHVHCAMPAIDPDFVLTILLTRESAAAASDVAIRRCATPGLASRDELLAQAAAARGLQPTPLEDQTTANAQRTKVPERIYRHQLKKSFTPESEQGLQRAVAALNQGDYDAILAALDDLSESREDFAIYNQRMLVERNRAWMARLKAFLNEGNAVINVGAAHLPGRDGLVALLRSAGYRVEPTLLPIDPSQSPRTQ